MPSIKEEDFFKVSGEYGSGVAINEYGGTGHILRGELKARTYPQRRPSPQAALA